MKYADSSTLAIFIAMFAVPTEKTAGQRTACFRTEAIQHCQHTGGIVNHNLLNDGKKHWGRFCYPNKLGDDSIDRRSFSWIDFTSGNPAAFLSSA
ncbi:hypothetical protein [Pantoea ananatis]|uniref:hypothetical protein n=1 Tax=Pantoea ananas TaxID=553 RepID=UPI0032EEF35C